ncbi:hypothetical protein [uncultured Gilvimarinus sp.]|uniref:hypothetical protein n=1 Tax=uncultured Gilvimarinus sp. TaxID=1689143 RepID=UPI0030EB6187|tara:strand:- start:154 stop:585 length:432 start_codon:yes stop_codon:yes gene_type:complete
MLSPFHPIQLILGLITWALYFVVLYAGLSISCEYAAPEPHTSAANWVIIALLALTLMVTAGLLTQARRGWRIIQLVKKTRPDAPTKNQQEDNRQENNQQVNNQQVNAPSTPQFINYVAVSVYGVAALATLINGLPLVLLTPCI